MVLEATEIEAVVQVRGITHLVHFTRVENLPQIFGRGLLPNSFNVKREINNRHDRNNDEICLSITHPSKMFYKMRENDDSVAWCVLVLHPRVLWRHDCRFYPINAVSKILRDMGSDKFRGVGALQAMFAEEIENHERKIEERGSHLLANMPTNEQAEVRVVGPIHPDFIYQVYFNVEFDIKLFQSVAEPPHVAKFRGNGFWHQRDYLLTYSGREKYLKWLKDRFS